MAEPDVLEAPNILEYPYARSVGPIIGRFMAALRDRRFLGIPALGAMKTIAASASSVSASRDLAQT